MTDTEGTDTSAPLEGTPEARRLLMLGLWSATLEGLKTRLEGDEAENLTASFFDTCVAFLRDSGINADTVTEAKDAMVDLHEDIARQVAEVMAEDANPAPPPPVKAKPVAQAEVVPLHRPFEPRPPR